MDYSASPQLQHPVGLSNWNEEGASITATSTTSSSNGAAPSYSNREKSHPLSYLHPTTTAQGDRRISLVSSSGAASSSKPVDRGSGVPPPVMRTTLPPIKLPSLLRPLPFADCLPVPTLPSSIRSDPHRVDPIAVVTEEPTDQLLAVPHSPTNWLSNRYSPQFYPPAPTSATRSTFETPVEMNDRRMPNARVVSARWSPSNPDLHPYESTVGTSSKISFIDVSASWYQNGASTSAGGGDGGGVGGPSDWSKQKQRRNYDNGFVDRSLAGFKKAGTGVVVAAVPVVKKVRALPAARGGKKTVPIVRAAVAPVVVVPVPVPVPAPAPAPTPALIPVLAPIPIPTPVPVPVREPTPPPVTGLDLLIAGSLIHDDGPAEVAAAAAIITSPARKRTRTRSLSRVPSISSPPSQSEPDSDLSALDDYDELDEEPEEEEDSYEEGMSADEPERKPANKKRLKVTMSGGNPSSGSGEKVKRGNGKIALPKLPGARIRIEDPTKRYVRWFHTRISQ